MLRNALTIAVLLMIVSLASTNAQPPGPIPLPPEVQSGTGAPAPGPVTQPTAPLPSAPQQPASLFPRGPGGTTLQPIGTLVGRWQGRSYQGGMHINTTLEFDPNGNLRQSDVFPNGLAVRIWGAYQVQPISATQITVSLVPTGWSPQEVCGTAGGCVPLHYAPQSVLMIFEDANTVHEPVINATFRRMP